VQPENVDQLNSKTSQKYPVEAGKKQNLTDTFKKYWWVPVIIFTAALGLLI